MQPHLPDFPPHIVIEMTYRCNLHCRMCWWWGAQGVAEARENLDDELSLAEWKKFVDSVAPFRPGIRITGGEPFLRPDSIELAAYITGQGLACSFITNGTLLDQARIERLVSSGVWQINFSIDSDRQGDESVRGLGAFDRTLVAIQALTAEKIRQKTGRPEVLVNCVVTPENVAGR
jgi:MoaA/NifB/PqqE/SkfB family radical SAM enzyme